MKLNNFHLILLISVTFLLFFIFKRSIFSTFEGMRYKKRILKKKKTAGCKSTSPFSFWGIYGYLRFYKRYLSGEASLKNYLIEKYGSLDKVPSYIKTKEPNLKLLQLLKANLSYKEKSDKYCMDDIKIAKVRYSKYLKEYTKYKNEKRKK